MIISNILLLYNVDILNYYLQDSLVEQSSQGSFLIQGRQDILTTTLGTDEHPGRVRAAGYGVVIRQYFGSASRSSSSQNINIMQEISRLKDELMSQIEEKLRDKLKEELRREFDERLESMGISQQHTPIHEGVVLPTRGKASTKGSYAAEDNEEDTFTDTSYQCRLFAGDPPQLVAIGRVFAMSSTLHTVSLRDEFSRVVVEKVRQVDVEVPVPHQRLDL